MTMLHQRHNRPLLGQPVDVAAILAEVDASEQRVIEEAMHAGPVQTVITGNCKNCQGEFPVDVTFNAPTQRPPVAPVRWDFAGHYSHVVCDHCGAFLSVVDLAEEGFDEDVQSAVLVMLRPNPRAH